MTDRKAVCISMGFLMSILAIVSVVLRVQARRVNKARLGLDDYTIFFGLICSIGICVALIAGAFLGNLGGHMLEPNGQPIMNFAQAVARGKVIFIIQVLTVLGPGLTKISVLLLYHRIFDAKTTSAGKSFLVLYWFLLALSVIWTISFFFTNLFGLLPISANWSESQPTHSINQVKMWHVMVISDIILDALILTLPYIPMRRLRAPLKRKLVVSFMFFLGGFVVVTGILRALGINESTTSSSPDLSYIYAPGCYWSAIEACSGVISACLPCLHPLFTGHSISSVLKSVSSGINAGLTRPKGSRPWQSTSDGSDSGISFSHREDMGKTPEREMEAREVMMPGRPYSGIGGERV